MPLRRSIRSLSAPALAALAVALAATAVHADDAPAPPEAPPAEAPPAVTPPADPSAPPMPTPTPTAEPAPPAPVEEEITLDDIGSGAAKEALNRTTGVASKQAGRLRDSPALITVITRDEIRRTGARDILDVLHLVPGLSFGVDVQGAVGPMFRGLWGQEGKVLVLFDGFEMNETMYLTAQIENHFPIQAIERVEVIRGPGSALYGGFAALAVINIVTRNASVDGFEVAGTYGQMWRGFGRANGEVLWGTKVEDGALGGLELSLGVFGGEAARSDRLFRDGYGAEFRQNWENASQGQSSLHATGKWGGFQAKLFLDAYRVKQRDHFGEALPEAIENSFYAAHLDLSYNAKIAEIVEITPRLNVKRQLPWYAGGEWFTYDPDAFDNYYKTADRARFQLPVNWRITDGMNLAVGADTYVDYATVIANKDGTYSGLNGAFENGENSILYWNAAAFAEYSLQSSFVNLTAGARYEFHSAAGSSFVPRIALTKSFDRLWVKGLLSGAFKPPGVENITLNTEILPESATVYEAEVGYDILDTTSIAVSLYRIEITNPIVFSVDPTTGDEVYANFDKTGSQGFDVELKMIENWGQVTANYSYTNSAGLSNVSLYDPGSGPVLRAAPEHKASAAARFNLSPTVSLGPTLVVLSERRGWLGGANNVVEVEPPAALGSVALYAKDLLIDGLDATVAVHNVLDTHYRYIQPYDGGHAPISAPGREFLFRLSYHL